MMAKDNTGILVLAGVAALAVVFVMKSKAKGSAENLGVAKVPVLPIDADRDDDLRVSPDGSLVQDRDEVIPDRYVPITSMPPESKWGVTNEDGSPVRPDAALARSRAQSIADHVRTKKSAYDRPKLAVWQALAGIDADGLYGPGTRTALVNHGAKNVPSALFKGA